MSTSTVAPAATATIAAQQQQVQASANGPVITTDIQQRVAAIEDDLQAVIHERTDVIHGIVVARVAQAHHLTHGPGGTGKSFLARAFTKHIVGSQLFDTVLDETTDPSQVFGPPDIKAMVQDGKTRRVPDGMLPEATDAFIDELFNGNTPLLHSLMSAANERIWSNNGQPSPIPLRSLYAGSNKINADTDLAAFFDRLHLRYPVTYLTKRESRRLMVRQGIARMAAHGRGTATSVSGPSVTVTLDELDTAHSEALNLDLPDAVEDTYYDIVEGLAGEGILVSDRRQVEGMALVLANAWVRGHTSVTVGDLDILAPMFWSHLDQAEAAAKLIIGVVNPGEAAALDLSKQLAELQGQIRKAKDDGLDDTHLRRVGMEVVRNAAKLVNEATDLAQKAMQSGTSTTKIDDVIDRANALKAEVGANIFGLDPNQMAKA